MPDDHACHDEYTRQTRRNLRYLYQQGAWVEEGWNIFHAARQWRARFPDTAPPAVVVLSGTWNNPTEDAPASTVCSGGRDVDGTEFMQLAVAALRAYWPDCVVLVLQAPHHLAFSVEPGYTVCQLKPGHGITMLCPPDATPIATSASLGVIVLCAGRTASMRKFFGEAPDPVNAGGVREELDLMRYMAVVLQAGQRILQMGCNRAQFFTAFLQYVEEHVVDLSLDPDLCLGTTAARPSPTPVRMHREGLVCYSFTLDDLMDAWGDEKAEHPDHLVKYWLDSWPVALKGQWETRGLRLVPLVTGEPARKKMAMGSAKNSELLS